MAEPSLSNVAPAPSLLLPRRPAATYWGDLALWFRLNQGLLLALGIFVALFAAFVSIHPRGLSAMVITSSANQGLALAFAAMAQTFPVLTGGLDLSVGTVLALSNCVASVVVNGSPLQIAAGIVLVLLSGMACGLLNGVVVVYGRIQPIIATLATSAIFTGFAYLIRPIPGGEIDANLGDVLTGDLFETVPTALILLIGVVVVVWLPFKNSVLGNGCYAAGSSEAAAYMSGLNVNRSKLAAYTMSGLLAALGGLFLGLQTLSGDAHIGEDYTLRSVAAVVIGGTSLLGGTGGMVGSILGAFVLRTINGVLFFAGVSPLAQPLFEGLVLLAAIGLGAARMLRLKNRLDFLSLQEISRNLPSSKRLIPGIENSVSLSIAAIIVLVLIGSLYLPSFLSLGYMIQQLRIASILGVEATGAMLVILLGHIDLSLPWVMTAAAMMATTLAGLGGIYADLAIPGGLLVGAVVGLLNGFGVGYLRLPSMILTLAMNAVLLGLAVLYTGGFAPQTKASALMLTLGRDSAVFSIPNVLWVWLALAVVAVIALRRTRFGRAVYALGNRERVCYLSGIRTSRVLLFAFVISGLCSALGGVLLAGRLDQSYQGMGNDYLLPAIAAVVLGGTHILGGRGTYTGTVAGTIVITLLASSLAVMQMPEASRQIIYGVVIIGMLLMHGRSAKAVN
jgi:ribose transport system permease protein